MNRIFEARLIFPFLDDSKKWGRRRAGGVSECASLTTIQKGLMFHDLLPKGRKERRRTDDGQIGAAQSDGRTSRSEKRRDL